MRVNKMRLDKLFASLDEAQVAFLAAELEDCPQNVAKKIREFASNWSVERKVRAARESTERFSDSTDKVEDGLRSKHSGYFTVAELANRFFLVEWDEGGAKWVIASPGIGLSSREEAEQVLQRYCQPWGGCWKFNN